jgi:hypothetical protein
MGKMFKINTSCKLVKKKKEKKKDDRERYSISPLASSRFSKWALGGSNEP